MSKVSKYLEFRFVCNKPKTKVYEVLSEKHGTSLGFIKWYGPWRQYAFFPEVGCLFNKGCLMDIAIFLNKLNKEQRKKD